jgi:hypothetical protein
MIILIQVKIIQGIVRDNAGDCKAECINKYRPRYYQYPPILDISYIITQGDNHVQHFYLYLRTMQ